MSRISEEALLGRLQKSGWTGTSLTGLALPSPYDGSTPSSLEWLVDRMGFFWPWAREGFDLLMELGVPLQRDMNRPALLLYHTRDLASWMPVFVEHGLDIPSLGEDGQAFLNFALEDTARIHGHPTLPEDPFERQCQELLCLFSHGLMPDASSESGQAFLARLARTPSPALDPVRRWVQSRAERDTLDGRLPDAFQPPLRYRL